MREAVMSGRPLSKQDLAIPIPAAYKGPATEEREQKIQSFLPFIKYQALRMASRLPCHVDAQDLINAGVLGLLDALEKFDASRGIQLKTYAEFRIRGAILDELRSMDWASRSTREKIKRLEEAYAQLERDLQRSPTEEEVADFLGLAMEDFHHLVLEARGVGLISIEDLFSNGLREVEEVSDREDSDDPHRSLVTKELRAGIMKVLEELSERERLVVTLYYYEEMTMKEIGLTFGVTESRVSQIHAHALMKLKSSLRNLR
jgi:RNA polymerase sigma factor for flagellar operon FliA